LVGLWLFNLFSNDVAWPKYPPFLPIDDSIGLVLLINFLMNDDYPSSLPKSSHVL